MPWIQIYDPAGYPLLSILAAALPLVVLLVLLGIFEISAQWAALCGLGVALLVSVLVYGMPPVNAAAAAGYGVAFGLLPIGWIVLSAVFLYNLTVATGQFEIIKHSIATLSADRRVQALLIGYSFGAFIEGAAGFGTPVAICAALLMGLGFPPLHAAGLCLIANTAPVAFGAIGTPILTLAGVTQQDAFVLGQMAGRQLPFVSVLITAWIVVTMSGWKGLRGVWPVVMVCGGSFAVVQYLWSNFVGPELVDVTGGLASLGATALFVSRWKPRDHWDFPASAAPGDTLEPPSGSALKSSYPRARVARAWMPWVFLSVLVFFWGLPSTKALLNGGIDGWSAFHNTGKPGPDKPLLSPRFEIPSLHRLVFRDYPVAPVRIDGRRVEEPAYQSVHAESAVYTLNWLSATGTGILLAALLTALFLGLRPGQVVCVAARTVRQMRWPLVTIACMLALGYVTRYSGTDATLGLAFTRTGRVYPFFAALLGWLGVALTGSDTSSNILFGSLQKITAQQLGLNPVLITTANSTGGVMGKMIDAQSIVVSTAATRQSGQEGAILRYVFWHSVALATIMGAIVLLQAYVFPWMVP